MRKSSAIRGCPKWARYVVTGCMVCGGVYWASSIEVARLVARYHGGSVSAV